ncbi:MAG TPA: hypothetical protein VFG69_21670, partial [Nannocystaceae bacterium]|nr:hypothetical protein [Nannocystaceae bacterium]
AQAVIAAQGPIADELAAHVAVGLYSQSPIDPTAAAARLRGALLAARVDPALTASARMQWPRMVVMAR